MIEAKKIVIDQNGFLLLQRKQDASPRAIVCPFRSGHHHCGDWCPHCGQIQPSLVNIFDVEHKSFFLDLTCGFGARIFADEANPEPEDNPPDHLAEIKNIMRPPVESFKRRLHNREGDEE